VRTAWRRVRERAEILGLPTGSRDHRTMPNRRLAEDLLRDAECSKVVAGAETQLRDDREIWIIRVPHDIDVASLNGTTVAMDRMEQTLPGDKKVNKTCFWLTFLYL
jgi:hypothetical protein